MKIRRLVAASVSIAVAAALLPAPAGGNPARPDPGAAPGGLGGPAPLPPPPGPGAGQLASPLPGDVTAGAIVLRPTDPAPATALTYQWRRSSADGWTDLDPAHVSYVDGGGPVAGWPVPAGAAVRWAVQATLEGLALSGPVEVRAAYPGGATAATRFRFDAELTSAASRPVGPGLLNLVTGDLMVPGRGVSVASYASDLAVGRTFRTKSPQGAGFFGPGWIATVGVSSLDARYGALRVTGPLVRIALPDGTTMGFTATPDPAVYEPEPGREALALTADAAGFRLTDGQGVTVTFTPVGDAHYPTSIAAPGTGQVTTVTWEATAAGVRPTRITGPPPPGVDCAVPVRGCRSLIFGYAGSLLSEIALSTWDPDGSPAAMSTVVLARYAYDAEGRLRAAWDPRLDWSDEGGVHHLADTYDYTADGTLTGVVPAGEAPWNLDYTGDGKLAAVRRLAATTTVAYQVPVSGSGAPYDLGAAQTARWGQDPPVTATAVSPPGRPPGLSYLDGNARVVNTVVPGGHADAVWYDRYGNVARELSAANRARALAAGGDTAAHAARLSTAYVYDDTGQRLLETFGPEHDQLLDGAVIRGRQHTVYGYGGGGLNAVAPGFVAPTTRVDTVRRSGTTDSAARTIGYEYHAGLRKLSGVVVDPAGLALASRTAYDPVTGLPTATVSAPVRTDVKPARRVSLEPLGPNTRVTVYYRADSGSGYPECDNRPEWTNLPCRVQAGDLPWTTYTYDRYFQPRTVVERTVDAVLRTTTTSFDGAGRPREVAVTGLGTPVPVQRTGYDPLTGLVERTQSVSGGVVTAEIVRRYDNLGRPVGYTDADGVESAVTYNLAGQVATSSDGRSTRTVSYDERGLPVAVHDPLIGTFTAGYDPDGNLVSQSWPAGITVRTTYDETGAPVGLRYDGPGGTLYGETLLPDAHGRISRHTGTWSQRDLGYDAAGRLTSVEESTGSDCARRVYGFDAATNRTGLTRYACGGGEPLSSRAWTFDPADRLTTAGTGYDALGRTTAVPAADLVQGPDVSVTYHVTDLVDTITQGARVSAYTLDVNGERVRAWSDGGVQHRHHYRDDTDNPAWTEEPGGAWTRPIVGPGGVAGTHDSTGRLVWQLATLHGDLIATLTTGPPSVHATGEYGEGASGLRYGWLGGHLRAADTPGGLILMGVRLYNPATGRFLTVDPVYGGNANDYEYCTGDPVNCQDLDGRAGQWWRKALRVVAIVGGVVGALACGVSIVCGVIVGGVAAGAGYAAMNAGTPNWNTGEFFGQVALGGALGSLGPLSSGVRGWVGSGVAGWPVIGQTGRLFGRLGVPNGVRGWFNRSAFRVGWGWLGTAAAGRPVFRLSIGGRHYWVNWHINIL